MNSGCVNEKMLIKKDRIYWIDIAKGILIFLVFWGHIETHFDTVSTIIFSFHMPAFFVLSGYTFKYQDNFKDFIFRRIRTLIFPYFYFCAVGGCIHLLYGRYELFGQEMLRQLFITVQPDWLYCGSGWFLIALFIANIGMYIWVKYFEQFDTVLKLMAICILFYFASNILIINSSMNITRLPFKIDSSIMGLFFMIVGFYLKKSFFVQRIQSHKFIFGLVFLLIYIPVMMANGWCNIANCSYNNYIFYLIESVTGTLLIIIFSLWMEKMYVGGGYC